MNKTYFLFLLLLSFHKLFAQSKIPAPDEVLSHTYGEAFTPHHELVAYFEAVAARSPQVILKTYGQTNQHRPLMVAIISSKDNLENLEDIRLHNLRKTGLIKDNKNSTPTDGRAIVWLSFGVHGNEAGASEASIATLYALANPADKDVQSWLENTIVILDPCLNPDGYSRYTHWNRNVAMKKPNPLPEAEEHQEPWPGGRVNHYLFDLNRDWAWQTQVESQQRIALYNQWMPHIHVDFHEQGYNNPYYFAPAAHPFHKYITDWQAEFQTRIGRNHTKYFDDKGWLYFTREIFDLFYPSYGDTWPTFNGAIGMTYEQAGHNRAGRAIIMENGDTLKLTDRIAHHMTTALSTVEISSQNARELLARFEDYFSESEKKTQSKYKSFVIKASNVPAKIDALCRLLDANGIRYGKVGEGLSLADAFDYQSGKTLKADIAADDLVINVWQPKSILAQVFFEPEPYLEDSLTYDITAWALPYAYGLEGYALSQKIEIAKKWEPAGYKVKVPASAKKVYAWIAPWKSLDNVRFLSAVLQAGIKVRFAQKAFQIDGNSYAPGTLLINRGDNRHFKGDLGKTLAQVAALHRQELITAATGYVTAGNDFGSEAFRFIHAPKILLLKGRSTSANGFGQVWHFLEQGIDYPLTVISAEQVNASLLHDYNLLILPEGGYSFSETKMKTIGTWISGGGRLIAIGSALRALEGKKGFHLKRYASEKDKNEAQKAKEKIAMAERLQPYAEQDRRAISKQMPGTIFKVNMDNSHPLAFGLKKHYFSLKTSTRKYQMLKNTWNVGTIDKEAFHIGFAGYKALEAMRETCVFAVQDRGAGSVVYMVDNPLFRGFWEEGRFLFANAVFLR